MNKSTMELAARILFGLGMPKDKVEIRREVKNNSLSIYIFSESCQKSRSYILSKEQEIVWREELKKIALCINNG